jgi:protein required for attachment to host cells
VVCTLIEPINYICSYREEVDQLQQKENSLTATIESEILAVRLDRIEKALARLSTQTSAPTQETPKRAYATAVQQPKPPQAHQTQKANPSAMKPNPEPQKVIVQITDGQEKQRVNELLAKEIVQKVNKGRINNQVIVARKLLLGEITLYTEDKEACTRLKTNTIWAKVLSL